MCEPSKILNYQRNKDTTYNKEEHRERKNVQTASASGDHS